ncbi:CheR family methyltransferase [Azospirillum rugosum]|uniref:protein-glutamate O-methyltransferase n=1 Tax=Azospirillum rugosum TaxID=416170 RepID=A0ABS4SXM3_9PROT|nr:CheR family methyltransferase [Azospirillum rugosum]MBP2297317.1 two-component system CheB/CheR fusion protein [Azospirillum rugosum]MDQ0530663.1 two-component system CheB/CheR fusion protein [Azospirillum rugosum]
MSSKEPTKTEPPDPEFEALIRYIQENRGLDFRGYKRTSLQRRIRRRMEEVNCDDFATYHGFLEAHPQEFVELLNMVLINVTSFFRDTEAWEVLKNDVVPRLLAELGDHGPIRIWSAGCASGEEPYSLAMLFAEALGSESFCSRVKIYATDLDDAALNIARHAMYAPRDVESVPQPLLEKYFERTNNHYVFQRELRKCVIFGRHNLVTDAPISRINLLVCRNLLIYLESETQNIVLPRLHYALANGGVLFLGKAETQLARSKMFEPVDLKSRIFRKVPQEWRRSLGGSLTISPDLPNNRQSFQTRLLESIVDNSPAAFLAVSGDGTLVFANAMARRLLDVAEVDIGRPFQDMAISYRPAELRSRIEEVQTTGRTLRLEHQEYARPPAEPIRLTIEVSLLYGADGKPFVTLLSFTDTTRVHMLQKELEAAQESLETTIEELQSSNEELETTNEELQSTNEELETTNEELQSTNEELETMNEELRSANEELEVANEELRRQGEESGEYRRYSESILRSMDVGIIVLDQDLRVRSWNRWSENMWGLRSEEVVGEEFLDLDIGLPVQRLRADLERILEKEIPQQPVVLDALDRRGRPVTCRVRLSPLLYESRETRGAVLIIEDITEQSRAETFAGYLGRVIGESLNEVYFLDATTFRFQLVNRGAETKLGYSLEQLKQFTVFDLMPEVTAERFHALVEPLLSGEKQEVVFESRMEGRMRGTYPVEVCLQLFNTEQPPILLAIVHDTTERQRVGADGDEAKAVG